MSLLRRRMMMQMAGGESFPREGLVFSHAGDELLKNCYKTNDGSCVCGLALLKQDFYSDSYGGGDYMYLILINLKGWADGGSYDQQEALPYANSSWSRYDFGDGINRYVSSTDWACSGHTIQTIEDKNINSLPIMNEITGKEYAGAWTAGGKFLCQEAAQDLWNYYNGVI